MLQAIDQWINTFITPVFLDNDKMQRAFQMAMYEPKSGWIITDLLLNERFRLTARLPETEEVIVKAGMLNWLTHKIFHEGISLMFPGGASFLGILEQSMLEGGQLLYSVQSWKAQSYDAWVTSSQYQAHRDMCIHNLTQEVAAGLTMFSGSHGTDNFNDALLEDVIKPAYTLMEKMKASRESFNVCFGQDSPLPKGQNGAKQHVDFEWENYADMTDHQRFLKPSAIDGLSDQQVLKDLTKLIPVSPGLTMRKIQRDNKFGDLQVIVKQKRLVAWKKNLFQATQEQDREAPTFYSQLCHGLEI